MSDEVLNEKVAKEEKGMRLDKWMKQHHPSVPNSLLRKWLRKGNCKVNGKKAKPETILSGSEIIRIPPYSKQESESFELRIKPADYERHIVKNILFQNDEILVLNKPAGLPTQGGSNAKMNVDVLVDFGAKNGDFVIKPKLCHRIDRDTSGILLLAKSNEAATALTKAFKDRTIKKTYWAIVSGKLSPKEGLIDLPLVAKKSDGSIEKAAVDEREGREAKTLYNVIDSASNIVSAVELNPETGRMHQIRIHMQAVGTPVLGDGKYGGKLAFVDGLSKKMHLHARSIELPEGILKKSTPLQFTAPIPPHIAETLEKTGLNLKA